MSLPTLDADSIRVLGSLIEKDRTTPEYYPLSLNALTNACNQKSNRDPVMQLSEADVTRALERLREAGLAMRAGGEARVARYSHNVPGKLHLEPGNVALLCELLIRGPQTAGELRARAERMHKFADIGEVEAALQHMIEREPPLIAKLARQPGRKESRYAHLLGGAPPVEDTAPAHVPTAQAHDPLRATAAASEAPSAFTSPSASDERMARMEQEIRGLRAEVDALWKELRSLTGQPE